ncbi:MAG: hypothetical protein DMF68_16740 [Acidobacteria bacterium]|nr:MAG: hypothetical protein DMF68_16740 [Acidobacteriota bacterium]
MKDSEIRRLEMLIRVRLFGAAHIDVFPTMSRGDELLAIIDSAITEMEGHATRQESGKREAREGTSLKGIAREALREDLDAISRTARVMALTIPGLEDKFRRPYNVGDQTLLAVARAFAQDAAPLKDEFIRRGLPANFLEDLNADIEAFEASINDHAQKIGERVAATASINAPVERALNAVRELDAIVRNIFRDDAATLAEWTSASHTERSAKRANDKSKNAQPAPLNG